MKMVGNPDCPKASFLCGHCVFEKNIGIFDVRDATVADAFVP